MRVVFNFSLDREEVELNEDLLKEMGLPAIPMFKDDTYSANWTVSCPDLDSDVLVQRAEVIKAFYRGGYDVSYNAQNLQKMVNEVRKACDALQEVIDEVEPTL